MLTLRRSMTLLTSLLLGIASMVCAQDGTAKDRELASGEHDMVLLLPDGPVHLQIQVADAGKSLQTLRQDYMQRLAVSLDVDQDGKVSRKETTKHPLFVSGRRFEGNKFLDKLRTQKDYSSDELSMAVERAAGQLVSFRQNNSLTDQDMSVFKILDENESGLIERAEMRTAAARLAKRDLDFDQCITFDEFLSTAPTAMMNNVVSLANTEPPGSVHSEMLRDASEPILAQRLVRRYDTDRDALLSAKELGWSEDRFAALDSDRNQLLSVQELLGIANAKPDLVLAIDLSTGGQKAMHVIGGRLAAEVENANSEAVKLRSAGMSLTVSYRQRDPLKEAEQNAREAFNAIDVDANGYLDRDEIVEHQRFERYLFDAMDSDDDNRVFAEEMQSYVKAYSEPASTSCQVTLFDTGNGYFQMLDQNADGRISIRELRSTEDHLLSSGDEKQIINPSRMTKSFRIEIQRGGVSLFGRVDRPAAEVPTAVLRSPLGPIWFTRMDRNGDGDLIWDEFLGPRETFHRLDVDQDGLVSAAEAESYKK